MNKPTLKDILEEMCIEEANEFNNMKDVPKHHFSLRHRRAMKKILSAEKQERQVSRSLPFTKRVAVVTLIVLLALNTVITGVATVNGFILREHQDNTELIATNTDNSPTSIKTEYFISDIPDDYKLFEKDTTAVDIYVHYKNPQGNNIIFQQTVKKDYSQYFNTDRTPLEEVDINGHYGLYLNFKNENTEDGIIVWDNGDYVMQIEGNFDKNSLINLAKSVKK